MKLNFLHTYSYEMVVGTATTEASHLMLLYWRFPSTLQIIIIGAVAKNSIFFSVKFQKRFQSFLLYTIKIHPQPQF